MEMTSQSQLTLDRSTDGMILIAGGTFRMGSKGLRDGAV
jgi:hypothetical protein